MIILTVYLYTVNAVLLSDDVHKTTVKNVHCQQSANSIREMGSSNQVTTNMAALQSEDNEFWIETWKKGDTEWQQDTVDSVIEVSNSAKNVYLVLLNESASCKLASYE